MIVFSFSFFAPPLPPPPFYSSSFGVLGLNSGLGTSHSSNSFFSYYFGDGGLTNHLPELASNHDPPNFSTPSR
jgi:hypothetical protein